MSMSNTAQMLEPLSREGIIAQLETLLNQKLNEHHTTNLIELGLDSLQIMRLVNHWRRAGAKVTFAKLIEKPTLENWLPLLTAEPANSPTLEFDDLVKQTAANYDSEQPFDLTDVQYAYWIGRGDDQALGGIGCHAYLEIDSLYAPVDPVRLQHAWHQLISQHSMLRARFTEDGKQFVSDEMPQPALTVHDYRHLSSNEAEQHAQAIRSRLSHRRLEIDLGQVMGLELTLFPDAKSRIHFDIDLLVADVQSLHILLRDLATAYASDNALPADSGWRFAHYLAIENSRNLDKIQQDKQYWQNRLSDLPTGPQLPLAVDPATIQRPEFSRRTYFLKPEQWQALRQFAASQQVTPSMVLATAYAEVLSRWSAEPQFLLNMPLFDRQTDHAGIDNVVSDFTNLLLLQCDHRQPATFINRVKQIQQQFHADVAHASYSAVSIQRDLVKQGLTEGVAAPVVFACNLGTPLLTEQCHTSLGDLHYMISQTPQVWLDHQLYEMHDGLLLAWDAVDALFPAQLIDDMFSAYTNLLEWLAADRQHWQQIPPELMPAYQLTTREAVNQTQAPIIDRVLHQGVFEHAKRSADKVALISDNASVTYAALADKALRIARLLHDNGLQSGDPVAVTLPRGIDQIAAVLGILAAGGCYVPVGIHQPAARQAKIHHTAGIKLVLTASDYLEVETLASVTRLDVALARSLSPLAEPVSVSPQQAAYIIFTSGSTGEPKGVEMAHAATANTIDHLNQRYQVGQHSTGLAISALDFDLSVYDIFGLLQVGGALVLVDESQRRDANAWLSLIHQHQVTLWNSVPVLLDMLLVVAQNDSRQLPFEQVMLSGDWIGLDLPPRLLATTQTMPAFIAMGGATEAAIWSNVFEVNTAMEDGHLPSQWTSIPYGKPLANQAYRVVDSLGRDCPDWVPGELWIGGLGLANGYRGDATLTAERFVEVAGKRWYRTGDRGRYWPDGNLEFLGRIDHQVKVRGHRIELGEIDAAMATLPEIARAVAVTVGQPPALAAAFVAKASNSLDTDAIRQALQQILPDYMVPPTLVQMADLPLSANGKLDRKQLAALLVEQVATTEHIITPPQTTAEKVVAELWQSLLGIASVGRESNFFTLGGDSLLATQVVAQLRQQGLSASQPLRLLFAKPVLMDFAAELAETTQAKTVKVVAEPQQRHEPFPLTEIQRAYWMGQSPGLPLSCGTHYLVELDGEQVDLERIERAWQKLVERHEMMRAVVDENGMQRILQQVSPVRISRHQLDEQDSAETAQAVLHELWHQQSQQQRQQPQQDAAVPYQLHAVFYGKHRCRLGINFNYLTLDGFSIKLLLEQLADLYQNPSRDLPELALSFRDYVNQVHYDAVAIDKAEKYWRNRLQDLPLAPELPLAVDPETLSHVEFKRREAKLDATRWQALKEKARAHQITPSVLLLVAYSQILRRWSGGGNHTLNLTLFDRQPVHADINQILGDFTSLAPVAFCHENGNTLIDQARATQQEIASALEHREISSIWIQRERSHQMSLTSAALPVVFTSTLGLGNGLFENPPAGFPEMVAGGLSETPQVWLDHQLYEYRGELVLSWDAVEDLFPAGLLDDMFQSYQQLLNELITQDWTQPFNFCLPTNQAATREAVNQTQAPIIDRVLHQGVFEHAKRSADKVALISDNASVTYAALADKALRIARLLHDNGLQSGDPVAVTLPRGIDQIAAVLGILAAGGCYVPVGIHQPAARQAKIHHTAGIKLVLTASDYLEVETLASVTRLDVALARSLSPLAEPVSVSPQQAAYIIFTSGSTGEPKGVEMAHAATANTIDHLNQRYQVGQHSTGLAISALDFDLSVYDIFGLLQVGGALVLVDESQRRDANAWLSLIHQHQVTLWNSVPVLLDMLLVVAQNDSRQLPFEQVMLSGDWIGLDLPPRLLATTQTMPAFIAMGGATEAAIWSNVFEVNTAMEDGHLPSQWTSIPYGKPLANQAYRVVDSLGRDCPDWVPGELWIGGLGLANGYRGDATLTAERFVEVAGKRWYRTGDRGRYWPDGNLEFLGRIDHQVKVRGHRIELGEIDAAMATLPEIARAVAVTVGQPPALAAAFVAKASNSLDTDAIRQALQQILPDYMVPPTLVQMADLPLSANGKLDRKQLAALLVEQVATTEHIITPPQTTAEKVVAELWQSLLGIASVGRESNFFTLGGDSLLATQVVAQLRQQGLSASQPLRLLFAKPVLMDFAAELAETTQAKTVKVVAEPQQRHEPFPLTEIQRAYWMGQSPGLPLSCGTHYLVELDGEQVDLERIERAWQKLVQRHEMLRVRINNQGQQQILSVEQTPALQLVQGKAADLNSARARIHSWWQHYSEHDRETLFALNAVSYLDQAGQQRYRLGLLFSYMTLDGFSIKLLLNELATLYSQPESSWPTLTLSFRDYVNQVQPDPQALERAEQYWHQRLPELPSAAALPLAKDPLNVGSVQFSRREARLEKSRWAALRQSAQTHGITPSVAILVAYAEILSQWSGGHAHTLNLTLFDRQPVHQDIDKIVGDFTSLAPVSYYPDQQQTLLMQAQQVQKTLAEVLEHREVSSVWVQRERARTMGLTAAALPIVFTSTLGMSDSLFDELPADGFPDLAGGGLSETPQVWLDHQMYEHRGELLISWDAVDELFPSGLVDDMFTAFIDLLQRLADNWHEPLPVALPANQAATREAVNQTQAPIIDRVLHQGVFEHAKRSADKVALISDNASVTYAALADKALRIARLLHDNGLQSGDPVAVTLPRGIDQIAAVLGILAAGGCYVPVGIHQPAARQAKIHHTAGIKLVLTASDYLEVETLASVTRLDVALARSLSPLAEPVSVSPQQAAYIIFTSGSTGEPKGVEMAHAATANTIDHLNQRYQVGQHSTGLAISALDFDLSVYDIFGLLQVGGALVLVDESQRRDANAWLSLIHQHQVTLWNSVPVLLDMLLVVAQNDSRQLPFEQVMLSGDWIGLDLPPRLLATTQTMPAFIAMGGATEAAIWSNVFEVNTAMEDGHLPSQWTSIPYGKPLANQAYRVVDSLGRDCPDWVPGELWIGGLGLANGYRGDATLTAERFVEVAGKRWYRTGDRGRYWPDGNLEFLGRIDHQVKVRGHRIELGEIDAAMATLPEIARAVAVTVGQPPALAAAFVAKASNSLDTDAIRQALQQILPDYMVPPTLVQMADLPLSANGKLDRKQLAALLVEQVIEQQTYEAPKDQLEQQIADVWCEVLQCWQISRHDDFFQIGGDSLTATQLVQQLQTRRVSPEAISLLTLFGSPTIAGLADEIRHQWQAIGIQTNNDELIFEEGTL
ncbi:iron aquisition yersiniabactin synthesis enzyme (Irp2) [Methylophaga frappieri]|uniref:Iron aquisition yersiniabactin synthesis enzyme (Irp2) n=1 Tax=Methylophaga frappieri (strain ATCC BAA-2434 / DSM 25690 / JAM7) TaxID=754477 RepID=I1YF67_METFJ|nr:non-ribosomal peptide synthetase [Methylophaga frappieri]AFJ01560.1 iron aquisition yersiniabactin synthesis enzyme (Irp2) [Methylophaga frappieri]